MPVSAEQFIQWQDPATEPASNRIIAVGQDGDLSAELRVLKGQIRRLSLSLSWVRTVGWTSGTNPDPVPVAIPPDQFQLTGDWSAWAVVGRRVMLVGATTTLATISVVDVSSGNTLVTVVTDGGGNMPAALTEVQWGPHPDAFRPGLIAVTDPATPTQTDLVIPVEQGGTGNITGRPGGVAGGDLSGSYPLPLVVGLRDIPLDPAAPFDGQTYVYDGTVPASWALGYQGLVELTTPRAVLPGDIAILANTLTAVFTVNLVTPSNGRWRLYGNYNIGVSGPNTPQTGGAGLIATANALSETFGVAEAGLYGWCGLNTSGHSTTIYPPLTPIVVVLNLWANAGVSAMVKLPPSKLDYSTYLDLGFVRATV